MAIVFHKFGNTKIQYLQSDFLKAKSSITQFSCSKGLLWQACTKKRDYFQFRELYYRIVWKTTSHYIHIMRTETRIIQEVVLY